MRARAKLGTVGVERLEKTADQTSGLTLPPSSATYRLINRSRDVVVARVLDARSNFFLSPRTRSNLIKYLLTLPLPKAEELRTFFSVRVCLPREREREREGGRVSYGKFSLASLLPRDCGPTDG